MAIDTQNKRRSALGLWAAYRVLPVPVSGIPATDRYHLWVYRGLAIGGGDWPPGIGAWNAYQMNVAIALPTLIFPRV